MKYSKALEKRNNVFYWLQGSTHSADLMSAEARTSLPEPYSPYRHGLRPTKVIDDSVFAFPGPHKAPQGIAFKSDDEMFVTVNSGAAIYLCTLSTSTCNTFWTRPTTDPERNQADILLVAPDGTLYFAGYWHQVSKCDSTGDCPVILGGPNRQRHKDEQGFNRIIRLRVAQ